jgi:hypothetical protein
MPVRSGPSAAVPTGFDTMKTFFAAAALCALVISGQEVNVSEPSTPVLIAIGLIGLAKLRRRHG